MVKKLGIAAVFFVAVAALGLAVQQFTMKKKSQGFLAYVPADTIYYFGGSSDEELANFFSSWPEMFGGDLFTSILDKDETPAPAKFGLYLLNKLTDSNNASTVETFSNLGISVVGPWAFYSHGAVPVYRMALINNELANTVIEEAVQESGWNYTWKTLAGVEVRTWDLEFDESLPQTRLAIAVHDDVLTISLISDKDDDSTQAERLALSQPSQSLQSSNEIARLAEIYNFDDVMIGFLHFQRIAEGLFDESKNSFGADLARYVPEDVYNSTLTSQLDASCQAEIVQLVGTAPRMVFGYEAFSIENDRLTFDSHTIQEMTNVNVVTELTNLQGSIPAHGTEIDNKLFALGLGLNANVLAPSLTAMWQAFVDAPFECGHLQLAQTQVSQSNPAMLGLFAGFLNGIKGVGLSIYDVTVDQSNPQNSTADALISIAADNPSTLVSTLQGIPGFNGITIPTDGTFAPLNHPMVPATIELMSGIKDNQLVLFTGENATKAASTSSSNTTQGLYSVGINYREIGRYLKSNLAQASQFGVNCVAQQQLRDAFSQVGMELSILTHMVDGGLDFEVSGAMDKDAFSVGVALPGNYRTQILNENCVWEELGTETIKRDGRGTFKEFEEGCAVSQSEYTWTRAGRFLFMNTTGFETRLNCDSEWEKEPEEESFNCQILNPEENGFQCLFDADTDEPTLYRYIKQA